MFGKLTAEAFMHNGIEIAAGLIMGLSFLFAIGYITYKKRWTWLWREWLTSLDPKKIGAMYIMVAFLMLFKGLVDAGMMRAQTIFSVGDSMGYLTSSHFQQLFTAHGATMIFFVGMGVVFGLMNLVVPLQIGARDVAFPFLNALSFWLFASGAALLIVSLVIGAYSEAGWVAYPPLSGLKYSPGVGVDYWIWSVEIAGLGSLLSGINFFVTIINMRCPGMTLMKMPIFIWSILCTLVLILFAFPILTVTALLLALDRLMDMHFFTAALGGNPMMYVNLIWAWGHPEVYILIFPAFGVFSEVVATFSHKRLFGYSSMVWALILITFLSFIVWLHHFFTMGAGANVNAFFGMMTMFIAIPTGVKVFNWLFTQYHGRVRVTSPVLWFMGFAIIFTTGGMTGVLMSLPPADFQVHNSLFLIAHFHSMLVGGLLFGFFAGLTYWFPKVTGFTLNEKLGKYAFWCWLWGAIGTFFSQYALGFMGATRRLDHYAASTGWLPLFVVTAIGVALICIGFGIQVLQIYVSIRDRHKNRDTTGDPWNGRTLEWSIPSPPPLYNFAITPEVSTRDPFWEMKQKGQAPKKQYEAILMPKNTPMALLIGGGLSFLFGFALVWQIMWLVVASLVCAVILLIIRLSDDHVEFEIPASEVEKMELAAKGASS